MEIILQIAPQRATQNESRLMTRLSVDFQNNAVAEARDAKLPAQIRFSESDNFPWGDFLQKLAVMWQLSQNESIPKCFRLKKTLPLEMVDLLPKVNSKDALNVLKQLGHAGFFSAFSKL
jgi:hypothetical protein